jgi:hypothetical protein
MGETRQWRIALVALYATAAASGPAGYMQKVLTGNTAVDTASAMGTDAAPVAVPRNATHYDGRHMRPVPEFVLQHAPLVHLFSEEVYWPSDIAVHVAHTRPAVGYDDVELGQADNVDTASALEGLAALNVLDGEAGWEVYLRSRDDALAQPDWIQSRYGIPADNASSTLLEAIRPGYRGPQRQYDLGGRSSAPALLTVVDKDDGVVDAVWHLFYSYNLGNGVFGVRFGSHVGDWEHVLVRFRHGVPEQVFLSQHAGGASYAFDALERRDERVCLASVRVKLTCAARGVLGRRDACHVCDARQAAVRAAVWPAARRDGPRAAVGPGAEHARVLVRGRPRRPGSATRGADGGDAAGCALLAARRLADANEQHPGRAGWLVPLCRALGRQVPRAVGRATVPLLQRVGARQRPARAQVQGTRPARRLLRRAL